MRKILVVFLALPVLVGCAGSPFSLAMMSAEELASQESGDLCNAWAFGGHKESGELFAELKRRDELTEDEWSSAEEEEIFIGMSELGLVCSWGYPSIYGDINESNYGDGIERQWVYRAGSYSDATYVYTKGGAISAWN